jgi:hypothetical protein
MQNGACSYFLLDWENVTDGTRGFSKPETYVENTMVRETRSQRRKTVGRTYISMLEWMTRQRFWLAIVGLLWMVTKRPD